jgi:hypothetical protein
MRRVRSLTNRPQSARNKAEAGVAAEWLEKAINNNIVASMLIRTLPFVFIIAFIALFGEKAVSRLLGSDKNDMQLRRQLAYLEAKYRKLKMLAESDLETLPKKDKSIKEVDDQFTF